MNFKNLSSTKMALNTVSNKETVEDILVNRTIKPRKKLSKRKFSKLCNRLTDFEASFDKIETNLEIEVLKAELREIISLSQEVIKIK